MSNKINRCLNCLTELPNEIRGQCQRCGQRYDFSACTEKEKEELQVAAIHRNGEFFSAADLVCRRIIKENPDNYLARWEHLLCKYGVAGIEREDGTFCLTCRKIVESEILEEEELTIVRSKAGTLEAAEIQTDAEYISGVQKRIKEGKDEKWDIFICYKETAENKVERTWDSFYAELLYRFLTEQGYKVFFARETLRGKEGKDYEAYIFNGINNARIMLVLGTKKEYFTSLWVSSEWKRFLKKKEESPEKVLITIYRGLDPARDLPEKISKVQGISLKEDEDTEEILLGRIRKILGRRMKPVFQNTEQEQKSVQEDGSYDLVAEGNRFLLDGDIEKACQRYESVKNENPEAAFALGCLSFQAEDWENAIRYFETAAEKQHADALYQLGFMNEIGIGVKKNIYRAREYYRSAKAAGRNLVPEIL